MSFVLCGPKFHGQLSGKVSAMKLIANFIFCMMQALLNYFESEKLLYSPLPQQMLLFWFKDNPGRISTTENCSFFFLFYVILKWLVLRTRTFHRNKRATRFHLAPLRCSLLQRRIYFTLDGLQSKQLSKRYSLKTFAS